MISPKATKPQLTNSMLTELWTCGIRFQRKYGARFGVWHEEEKTMPNVAMAVGSAVHRVVEASIKRKIEEGATPPREQVGDLARDEFSGIVQAGLFMTENEAQDKDSVVNKAEAQAIALSQLHHDFVLPEIRPVKVEQKFVLDMTGWPFDLAGRIDLIEEDDTVSDVKTTGKTMGVECASSMQMATYWLAAEKTKEIIGRLPKFSIIYQLIKTKIPKFDKSVATPTPLMFVPVMDRFSRAVKLIEAVRKGHCDFPAAATGANQWACKSNYCPFHATCPAWSRS